MAIDLTEALDRFPASVPRTKCYRDLQVKLTDEERLALGAEMSRSAQDMQRATDRKAEATKQYAAEIERHKANVMRLGELLANGYEYRDVECVETAELTKGTAFVVRQDTGEVVRRRVLRPEEMQGELPLDSDDQGDE